MKILQNERFGAERALYGSRAAAAAGGGRMCSGSHRNGALPNAGADRKVFPRPNNGTGNLHLQLQPPLADAKGGRVMLVSYTID